MKPAKTPSVFALLALLLCLTNAAHAALEFDEYIERAQKARQRGDWQDAATNYAEALNHPDRPRKPADWSELHLDYGRAMGVLCQYGEATMFLERGLDIAKKGGVSPARALYELGSVAAVEKKHALVVMHLNALLSEFEKRDAAQLTPAQWADARTKLALSLEALGKSEEAARWRTEATKTANPGTRGIVPYGLRCSTQ
jgi:tetratricopeptide (TPR) repeat protein